VVEAIIGAAYITNGDDGARQAAKALHIPIPSIDRWTDLAERALTPPRSFQNTLWSGTIEAVEAIAGIKVERPHFLVQALVSENSDRNIFLA
jgi:endoribonuclease Dicer